MWSPSFGARVRRGSNPVGADASILNRPLHQLPDPLPIPVVSRPFDLTIRPPGSKSLTNRALLLAALATGESRLTHALVGADDTRVMIAALRQLGARIEVSGTTVTVKGVGGRWRVPAAGVGLDLSNAGTATRFLAAAAVLVAPVGGGGGAVTIDGSPRMRERPISELSTALRALGARIDYLGEYGFPPVR